MYCWLSKSSKMCPDLEPINQSSQTNNGGLGIWFSRLSAVGLLGFSTMPWRAEAQTAELWILQLTDGDSLLASPHGPSHQTASSVPEEHNGPQFLVTRGLMLLVTTILVGIPSCNMKIRDTDQGHYPGKS